MRQLLLLCSLNWDGSKQVRCADHDHDVAHQINEYTGDMGVSYRLCENTWEGVVCDSLWYGMLGKTQAKHDHVLPDEWCGYESIACQ